MNHIVLNLFSVWYSNCLIKSVTACQNHCIADSASWGVAATGLDIGGRFEGVHTEKASLWFHSGFCCFIVLACAYVDSFHIGNTGGTGWNICNLPSPRIRMFCGCCSLSCTVMAQILGKLLLSAGSNGLSDSCVHGCAVPHSCNGGGSNHSYRQDFVLPGESPYCSDLASRGLCLIATLSRGLRPLNNYRHL
jgi:hypothetical protein